MLFHLVKKDFLIVKKYVLLMLLVSILIPLFMLWRVPAKYAGSMGFLISVIFAVFMLLQYVSMKEDQYPKAAALLCAAPYPRRDLVLSKYIFCLVIYAGCCILFGVETLIFRGLGTFHLELQVFMFFVLSLFLGIYLPMQYQWGYEKTKFVFAVIIMASPFILPQLLKMDFGAGQGFLRGISPLLLYGGMMILGAAVLTISAVASVKIYNRADLA